LALYLEKYKRGGFMLWKIVMVSLGVLFCLPTLSSADTMFGITGFETKSVEGGKIYNFSVDSLNRIWAAESAGVWVLDASTGSTIRNLPIGSGKLLGPARDLVIGDSGVVIATDSGAVLYNENLGTYKVYTKSDGLAGNKVSAVAIYHGPQGPFYSPPKICAGTENGGAIASLNSTGLSSWSSGPAGKPFRELISLDPFGGAFYGLTVDGRVYTSRPTSASWVMITDSTIKYQTGLYDTWLSRSAADYHIWYGCKDSARGAPYVVLQNGGPQRKMSFDKSFSSAENIKAIIIDSKRTLFVETDSNFCWVDLSASFLGIDSLWNLYGSSDSAYQALKLTIQKFPRKDYDVFKDSGLVSLGLNKSKRLVIGGTGKIVEWTGITVPVVSRPTVNLRSTAGKKVFVGIFSVDGKLVSREQTCKSNLHPGVYLFISQSQGQRIVEREIITSR
jgi:hypothetical protein